MSQGVIHGPHPDPASDVHKYPYQRSDGRWCIAHDDEWNEIVIDDMDGIDPSQFQEQAEPATSMSLVAWSPAASFPLPGTSSDPLNLDTALPGDALTVTAEGPAQNMDWNADGGWGDTATAAQPAPGPGVSGLTNLGNTCFMNAGLQCLLNNPLLVQYFMRTFPKESDRNLRDDCLTACFAALFSRVWSESRPDHNALKPAEFKEALGRTHSQFKDFRQHDCQEFLALLLGTLQEQLSASAMTASAEERCRMMQQLKKEDMPAPESVVSAAGPVLPEAPAAGTESTDTSSVSSQSSSVDLSTDSFRCEPLPSGVESFSVPDEQPQNNLVPMERLNKHTHSRNVNANRSNVIADSLTRRGACAGAGDVLKITLNDLSKQVKVANSNLLTSEAPKNNQLSYNSSKFPKMNELPKQDVVENLRADLILSDSDDVTKQSNSSSLKRSKTTNVTSNGEVVDVTSVGHNNNHKTAAFTQTSPVLVNPECKRIKTSASQEPVASGIDNRAADPTDALFDEGAVDWDEYLTRNRSVIVDTFHGQFKSTVKCSKCSHVSVTFEPFMYLPVPLPHALEKQVVLTFISSSKFSYGSRSAAPVRYLVDVHKYDRLSKVIIELKTLLKSEKQLMDESSKIVIAEVRKNSVERILDDGMLLRFAEDKNLFAFELPPVPSFACSSDSLSLKDDPTPPDSNEMDTSHHFESCDTHNDQYDLEGLEPRPVWNLSPNVSPIKTDSSEQDTELPCSQDSGIGDDHKESGDQPPFEFELPVSEPFDRTQAYVAQTTDNPEAIPPVADFLTCCVCLDSKLKEELVEHPSPCSCVICTFCLDRHLELNPINQTDRFHCPTCNAESTKSEFLPLEKPYLPTPAKTIIVPVVFRIQESSAIDVWNADKFQMLSHPVLLQLPNQMTCAQLYESVEAFVPFPLPYTLRYVNSSGQKCSRCSDRLLKSSDCTGCEIARIGSVTLTYSDAIAVEFDATFEKESLEAGNVAILEHESMTKRRPVEELKLEDCISEFHQSEVLDDENPWFCPSCHSNQRAHKSLSIWRSPPILMVYLKRFIFHDMMPIKVDDPVSYPMQLTVCDSLKNAASSDSNYELDALVCHYGGVSAGHYTAYAKHCMTGKWLYCNDSSVTSQEPSLNDERAYILFYRRSGQRVDLDGIPVAQETGKRNSCGSAQVAESELQKWGN